MRALVKMNARSAIHLGPMPRFVLKFIRISVDDENIENDMKTIMWTENILSVFGAKAPFSNLSGLFENNLPKTAQ